MPMRPEFARRGMLLAASLVCTAVCAGCGEVHAQLKPGPPRPLAVAIAGRPSGLYAPLYAAQADGLFRLGALAVTISEPADALKALESGAAKVAVVSEPALLDARARGAQLVAIGALTSGPLDAIVSLAARPVTKGAQLAGATIALSPTPLAAAQLATVLTDAGLAASSVHRITPSGSLESALHDGRSQATLGATWPIEAAQLTLAHQRPHVLSVQQAGVPTYSQLVLAVRLGEAHYDGPLLRAFLQSLTRGERAVAANPAAAAAVLAKANPAFSATLERALLRETLPIASPANAKLPFGYQYPSNWQAFGVWMNRHGLLAGSQNAGDAITDEFLPGQGEAVVTP
jgi:putative hydroxymethylpyrimidine transport system substrate-binding protein